MPIHILPAEVASQIAAGEVIERPASVVKEVLENSLDAEATAITIQVEGAGKRLIEIADDGCGIPAFEISLAIERHATSKLTKAADLTSITTLGFRGEALASIASVSRLTITSRPPQADVAARIQVSGGHAGLVEPIGAPFGTVVRVEDLFFNLPARLKFLKHDTTEKRQIDSLVTRYAMAYPQVRFSLRQDGHISLQTSGKSNQREVLAVMYGVETARQMLEVVAEDLDMQVRGFISPISLTRSNRREISFFINGRPVQDTSLSSALLKAYHTLLMVGRYPIAILFIDIHPEWVDVNVHPTKAEVRFRDPDRIFTGIQRAVRRALLAYTPVSGVSDQLHWSNPTSALKTERDWDSNVGSSSGDSSRRSWEQSISFEPPRDQDKTEISPELPSRSGMPVHHIEILRLIGQVACTYLVAEGPDGLYLIDQHAAHERILFERFMAQRSTMVPAQSLLNPAVVELSPAQARALSEQLIHLSPLGFQVESFGLNTFLVRTVPSMLAGIDPAAAIRVVVEEFEEDETPLQAEIEARLVARICKRAAVKAGKILSPEEQRNLLNNLEACQSPRTCPHGRPTMIHISVDLLNRQFGRKGAR